MKRNDFKKMMFLLLAGFLFVSCQYTADDYVKDMKALTKETVQNASSYSAEDWKRVGTEYKELNEKGKQVLKDLTEEQREDLKEWKEEMRKEVAKFDSEELKEQFKDLVDQANDFVKDVFKKD